MIENPISVEDAAGLLLSSQGVFGVDDKTGRRMSTVGFARPLVGPGSIVPHARMEFTGKQS